MESLPQQKTHDLMNAITEWLASDCLFNHFALKKIKGDAGFRQYFRVNLLEKNYIVMTYPPHENAKAYVDIGKALNNIGLLTPEIYHFDQKKGFYLITDFGDQTYLKALNEKNVLTLYEKALDALCLMQGIREVPSYVLPTFNKAWMWQEWLWHKEWFLLKFLKIEISPKQEILLDRCIMQIIETCIHQPQVFMHRDYHSNNLMLTFDQQLGILDFQDAFIGPITYDLVSLLRDCYIDWPDSVVSALIKVFYDKLLETKTYSFSRKQFLTWFDWMSVERHLKTLFTFARKSLRDKDHSYLKFIPRTLNYLVKETESDVELNAIHQFIQNEVYPSFLRQDFLCEQ